MNDIDYTEHDNEEGELKETFTAPKSGWYEISKSLDSKAVKLKYLRKGEKVEVENENE